MFQKFIGGISKFCKQQMLKNIVREWVKLASNVTPTRTFYLDEICNNTDPSQHTEKSIDEANIKKAFKFYSNNLHQWLDSSSSFGIVFKHNLPKTTDETVNDLQCFDFDVEGAISLVLFCDKEETLQLQQSLTRGRYHWYRKFSKSPLNSGFKSALDEQKNTFNIMYQPKHMKYINDNQELKLDDIILNQSKTSLDYRHDVIVCKSKLNHCLAAFLDDSFMVTDNNQIVMKLNPSLVPFKVAFYVETNSSHDGDLVKFHEVVDYLIDIIKEYPTISMYPYVRQREVTLEQFDQMGVKYVIILKPDILKTGILYLRNRDSRISEMVHISSIVKTLLFYLQPEKLASFEMENYLSN